MKMTGIKQYIDLYLQHRQLQKEAEVLLGEMDEIWCTLSEAEIQQVSARLMELTRKNA